MHRCGGVQANSLIGSLPRWLQAAPPQYPFAQLRLTVAPNQKNLNPEPPNQRKGPKT